MTRLMTRRGLLLAGGATLFGTSAVAEAAELVCGPGEFRKFSFTPGEADTCVAHSPKVQALLALADGEPEPLPQELVDGWDLPDPQPAQKAAAEAAPAPVAVAKASEATAEAPARSLRPAERPRHMDRIVQVARAKLEKQRARQSAQQVAVTKPPKPAAPVVSDSQRSVRRGDRFIHVQNKSLSKPVKSVFFTGGRFIDDENDRVNIALRDHYNQQQADMKRRLLVLMADIYDELQLNQPFFLVSGYRSKATNDWLRRKSIERNGGRSGVAKNSRHTLADAADLCAPGHSTHALQRAARRVRSRIGYGGVGLYTASSFVHVDGGPARSWGA